MYYEDIPQSVDLVRWIGAVKSSVAPFAPTDIVGLQWWFKADSLALSDADPVSSWLDSSGNGYTATQATGINQPLYKTAILNGLPVVRFDGSNDKLTTASITHGIDVGDQFYAAVAKSPSVLSGYKCMCDMGTDAPAFFMNGTKVDWYQAGDKIFAGNVLSTSTWYTIIVRRFGGTLESYVNSVVDTTTFLNSAHLANAAMTIGDEGGAGGSPWNGDIAEIMMGKTLSDTDRDSLTTYLRSKYAHY